MAKMIEDLGNMVLLRERVNKQKGIGRILCWIGVRDDAVPSVC
jgi:hypothetical protein